MRETETDVIVVGAGNAALCAALGVLSERLRVACSHFGVPRAVARGLFGRLRLCCGGECCGGGFEALATGGCLVFGGA